MYFITIVGGAHCSQTKNPWGRPRTRWFKDLVSVRRGQHKNGCCPVCLWSLGGLFVFQFLVLVVYFVMDAKYFGLYLFIDINLANKTVNNVKILSGCVYCI